MARSIDDRPRLKSEASESERRIVAVLLAAGAARRYGRAKQLERHAGSTLVRGAAEAALKVADELIVVTGGHAERVEAELADLPLRLVRCADWSLGMGHSIAAAFRELRIGGGDRFDAALLCLADQPLVRSTQLHRLVSAWNAQRDRIVVSDYGDRRGPPCLFPAEHFPALSQLGGDTGAREILKQNADRMTMTAMPEAATDIDTEADYLRLTRLTDSGDR